MYVCMSVCVYMYVYVYLQIHIISMEKHVLYRSVKLSQQVCLLCKPYRDYYFLHSNFPLLIIHFFYSDKFLVFLGLIKCQNVVVKTCDNQISPNDNYSILQAKLYVCKCVGVCVCEYVCMYICICVCTFERFLIKYHQLTL